MLLHCKQAHPTKSSWTAQLPCGQLPAWAPPAGRPNGARRVALPLGLLAQRHRGNFWREFIPTEAGTECCLVRRKRRPSDKTSWMTTNVRAVVSRHFGGGSRSARHSRSKSGGSKPNPQPTIFGTRGMIWLPLAYSLRIVSSRPTSAACPEPSVESEGLSAKKTSKIR